MIRKGTSTYRMESDARRSGHLTGRLSFDRDMTASFKLYLRPCFQQLLHMRGSLLEYLLTPRKEDTGLACWHPFSPKRTWTSKQGPSACFSFHCLIS